MGVMCAADSTSMTTSKYKNEAETEAVGATDPHRAVSLCAHEAATSVFRVVVNSEFRRHS